MTTDALSRLMHELSKGGGSAFRDRKLAGFAILSNGKILETTKFREKNTERSIYQPISKDMFCELFYRGERDSGLPSPGSIVTLVGHMAFPCVCEVPDVSESLFATTESSVIAAGVKWQSLYLVFKDRFMILAEPERDGYDSSDEPIFTFRAHSSLTSYTSFLQVKWQWSCCYFVRASSSQSRKRPRPKLWVGLTSSTTAHELRWFRVGSTGSFCLGGEANRKVSWSLRSLSDFHKLLGCVVRRQPRSGTSIQCHVSKDCRGQVEAR